MKLLVLNYEYPPIGGGAGVIAQNISERLALFGHQVTVITTWYKTEKEITENGNLKVIRLKSKRKHTYKSSITEMLSWVHESRKFLNHYCRTEKFDLCFANFAIPSGIVALFLKRKYGLKYTVISHGHDIPWRFPKQMLYFHIVTYFWIKKICIESEMNFMQTKIMMDNINRFLGKKYRFKNMLILNGLDTRLFMPDPAMKSKQFKMVFTGRLVEQKDPFTVLKAVKLFSEKHKDFTMHIMGDGVLRKGMEDFVNQNGLADNIKFFGWVSKEQMVKEYQTAHVNVIASIFEGMSIGVFESLACGCFLVTTPIDDVEHIITEGENAFIVANFASPLEMTEQLEHYYNDKYLNNYAVPEKLINELKVKYDWNHRVEEYEAVFKKITGL